MAWLRRSRLRNRDHKNIAVSTTKQSKTSSISSHNDPTRTTHHPYKPKNQPLHTTTPNHNHKNKHNPIQSTNKTDKLLPNHKHHRRFFSLFRRKHTPTSTSLRPHTSPTTTHNNTTPNPNPISSYLQSPRDDLTYDGTLDTMDMSYGTESNSTPLYLLPMNPPGCDTDALPVLSMDDDDDDDHPNTEINGLFRRPTASYPSVIAPRQSSDVSQLSSISRRGSDSSAWSGSNSTLRDDSAQSLRSRKSRTSSGGLGEGGAGTGTGAGGGTGTGTGTGGGTAGGAAGGEDSGSVSSTSIQSSSDPLDAHLPLRGLFRLRNSQLAVIPDTSLHSHMSGSRPSSSKHGNGSLHGSSRHSGGSALTRERMERTLLQRTAMMEDEDGEGEYEVVKKPGSAPKPRSFLDPVVSEPMTFGLPSSSRANGSGGGGGGVVPSTTTATPTAAAASFAWDGGMEGMLPSLPQTIHRSVTPTDSLVMDSGSHSSLEPTNHHPAESAVASSSSAGVAVVRNESLFQTTRNDHIHLIPLGLDRDLSEDPEVDDDEEDSRYHLPTDLSMDVESESIVLVPSEEVSTAAVPPPPPPLSTPPGQDNPEMDLSHSQSPHPTTALSTELLPNRPFISNKRHVDPFGFSGCGSPKTAPTPSTPSSHGSSSREDVGHTIRASILSTQMFDSDCEPCTMSSSSASESNSCSRGSISVSSPRLNAPQQHDEKSSSSSSFGSNSFHFCNMPVDLPSDTASKQRMEEDEDDSDSEGANAASSDEDINALEELYADIFGNDVDELEKDALMQPAHANGGMEEDANNGVHSMLGLFKDDRSCQSSVVSFDSTEFMEDDPYDDLINRSKTSCSVSMHDITTIHEENEDDIAEEEPEVENVSRMMGGIMHHYPMPLLNGELHLNRQDLMSQGTTTSGGFSSVTDDSYMGCMSFDSLSSFSDKGNSPIYGHQRKACGGIKMDMSHHDDFVTVPNPNPNPNPNSSNARNEESSQFTYESSKVSFADSACSYDSFSSESVKYMVDILKEEAERRRSKIKERIAKIRESTNRASHISEYMASSMASIGDKMDD